MMKRILTLTLVAVSMLLAQSVLAQMMGAQEMMQQEMMRNIAKQQQTAQQGQQNYPAMMGGYGYGPRMMSGFGMGPYMMGGYGMGPDMMHGYGMGHGMMGAHGYCQGPVHMWNSQSDEYNTFMDQTKETRKKLHDLHFAYGEKLRNPETTVKELREMEKEMNRLQEELRKKAFTK